MQFEFKFLKMYLFVLLTLLMFVSSSYGDDAVEALSPVVQFKIDRNLIMDKEILIINKRPNLNPSSGFKS